MIVNFSSKPDEARETYPLPLDEAEVLSGEDWDGTEVKETAAGGGGVSGPEEGGGECASVDASEGEEPEVTDVEVEGELAMAMAGGELSGGVDGGDGTAGSAAMAFAMRALRCISCSMADREGDTVAGPKHG